MPARRKKTQPTLVRECRGYRWTARYELREQSPASAPVETLHELSLRISTSWSEVVDLVKTRNAHVYRLLKSVSLVQIEESDDTGALTLFLRCYEPLTLTFLRTPEHRAIIEWALAYVLDRPIAVSFTLQDHDAHAAEEAS